MTQPPNRQLPVRLEAPVDEVLFHSMEGCESISTLFEYEILVLSSNSKIAAKDLLGKPLKVSIDGGQGQQRWFHGLCVAFGIDGNVGRYHRYRLTLRPWLWLLTRSSNLRIFQDMTALQIVKRVFGEHTSNFVDETGGRYPVRPYCVQYRETDFNFVSRLLEDEGISYFFRHSAGGHTLVLVDAASALAPVKGGQAVRFMRDEDRDAETVSVSEWRMNHEIQPGRFALSDWDFESPSTRLETPEAQARWDHAEANGGVFDYPGGFQDAATGRARNAVRKEEWESRAARFEGRGNVPWIAAGFKLDLVGHPRPDQNAEYAVLSVQLEMTQTGQESVDAVDETGDKRFSCSFVAQPAMAPLRPARLTPKPTVAGPQTAMVVGDAGAGDILTDAHGRVKVQFHWDREGQRNANSSCWVRVATPAAGKGWGMVSLPRIGQEVVVDFLEGDPDRPLITGSVYNADHKPPYALPAHATVSTWKSRSKLGAAADFNELRFEDKAGSEYLLLHAQKDRLEFVEDSLKSSITKNEHRTVQENRYEKVGGEWHLSVGEDAKQAYGKKLHLKVGEGLHLASQDKLNLKSGKDLLGESGASIGLKSGTDLYLKIGQNFGAEAAMNVHIKGGMNLVLEAGTQLSIKGGAGSIVLDPSGVSITGPMVKINSGGSAGSGAGAKPMAPAAPDAPTEPELPQDPLSHR
jgi:type VI secretion system secreted protein VgrG